MIIVDRTPTWPHKVNFADANNVMLGYDLSQSCCEDAWWFLTSLDVEALRARLALETDYTHTRLESDGVMPRGDQSCRDSLAAYTFDTTYRETLPAEDGGGVVLFKLTSTNANDPPLLLGLVNLHNGYYGHGFDFTTPDGTTTDYI